MKKGLLVLGIIPHLCLLSCSATKPAIDNNKVLSNYHAPYKVFGIGYWKPGYSILTLTDAGNKYFVIKTTNVDSLKIGNEYRP